MKNIYLKIKTIFYQLLRKSEKFTKTDMVYLAKGGFWLTSNRIIYSVTALVLAVAYANLLSKNDYGLYKYVLSIASILSIASLTGMSTALARSVSLGFEGSIKKVIKTKLKWSIWGGLGGLLISAYYFYNQNTTLGILFILISIFNTLISSLIIYGSFLQGKKLFKQSAILSSASQIFITISIIIALLIKPKVISLLIAFYLSSLVFQGLISLYVYKKYKSNNQEDPEIISYGKHLSLMTILGTIGNHLDKIIIWHLLGPAQLAIYSFAILPINQALSFLSPINTLAFPKLAGQKKVALKKTLPSKILKFIFLLIFPVLLYIILAPFLFKLIFPQYMDSVVYSQIFALTTLLFPLSIIGSTFAAKADKRFLYILKTVGPITKIGLFILLIPVLKIWGAIIALLLTPIIKNIVSLSLFNDYKNNV